MRDDTHEYDFSAFCQSRLEDIHIESTEHDQTCDEFYAITVKRLANDISKTLNLQKPADDTLYQDLAAALVNCRIRAASSSSHRDEHKNEHENETKTASSSTTATAATTTNSICSSPAAAAACRRGVGRPDQRPTHSAEAPFGYYDKKNHKNPHQQNSVNNNNTTNVRQAATSGGSAVPPLNTFAPSFPEPMEISPLNGSSRVNEEEEEEEEDEDYQEEEKFSSLKKRGHMAYSCGNYKDSIIFYSEALKSCISLENSNDLAVIYGNRAAGLMMLGACSAALAESDKAIKSLTQLQKEGYWELRTEYDLTLMATFFWIKGKALLKNGEVGFASEAFLETKRCARDALGHGKLDPTNQTSQDAGSQAEKVLKPIMTDVEECLKDIERYNEAETSFEKCGELSDWGQALMHVNAGLSVAVNSEILHLTKLKILASLKRWMEVASHCERIAADAVKLDGAFVHDLANMNPFEGAPPAIHLTPGFFEGQNASLSAKLSEKAVGEAILRLPHSIMAFYLRSLRLEERYEEAHRARTSLEMFVGQMSSRSTVDYRVKFAWLSRETDKLERTMRTKDSGDKLFRSGEYRSAAEKYACCLQIDAEGVAGGNPLEPNTAGGRLHAVLHCNRAACLMALGEYRDALKDCQAALRIHNHYMKAILRKARCYARLERYEDAMTEYKKYIKMVDDANMGRSPVNTTCCFDLPSDIDSVELKKVKQELKDVQQEKLNVERREAEEAAKQKERKKWYDENFNSQSDAQSRRNQWYNSKEEGGSFRWDPYGGRSPNKSGRGASYRKNQQSQSQQHQQDKPQNQKRPNASSYQYGSHQNRKKEQPRPETHRDSVDRSSSSNISDTHYSVLKVNTVATDADIKKAYRKMALLYHPDKNKDPSAADTFRRIKDAFEVLSDETERRKYDRQIGIAGVRPFVYRGM